VPRSANGTYTLPIAAFAPGGLIKASDHNSNYGDIATALTQSLATTGVSSMTGPLLGAAGLVTAPGYTFSSATKTGFYLAGTNQIGWTANGVQGATLNSDLSTTWAGGASFNGKITGTMGTIPIGAVMDHSALVPAGWLGCGGQAVSRTTYAALFAIISTIYGAGDGSTTFNIPDLRGRSIFGLDNMGVGGNDAGRITLAGGNYAATSLGANGGLQNRTLLASQIPTITSSGGALQVTVNSPSGNVPVSGAAVTNASVNTGGGLTNFPTSTSGFGNGAANFAATAAQSVTSNNTSGQSFPTMNPSMVMFKIIYAGV
jgi:microcystin-dependent protein